MMRLLLVCAVVLSLATPVAWAQTAEDDGDVYLLRPGDTLGIFVLEDPTLNRDVLIRPDGRISLPLAGTVQAAGRTPEQVQADISRALARDFLQPPSVTVSLISIGDGAEEEGVARGVNESILVIGQVGRQGRLGAVPPIDILRALALAGGLGQFAATDRIQVRRRIGATEQILLFNYDKIEDGLLPGGSFELIAGDIIVVPQRGLFE